MRLLIVVLMGSILFGAQGSLAMSCSEALNKPTDTSLSLEKHLGWLSLGQNLSSNTQVIAHIQKTLTDYANFYLSSSESHGLGLELSHKLMALVEPSLLGRFIEQFLNADHPTRTYLLHSLVYLYKSQSSVLELSLSPYGVNRPENQIILFLGLSRVELQNKAHKAIEAIPELKHQVMNLPY